MSRIVKVAVLASVLALFGVRVRANTAASCATGDVQSAINSAAEGGTVSIPAGTCTWTSGVTISGKGVDVEGAGGGGIIAYSSNTLTIGTGAKSLTVSGTQVSGTPATPAAPQITSGETLRISELGNRQNYMLGTVTSFNSGTGALAMSVASDGGSCGNSSSSQSPSNCKRWLVSTVPQTVIINNSSSTIFSVTEDSSFNTRLGNFKIQEGTGGGDGVDFIAGGGKAIVLHDCWIEQGSGDSVHTAVNRGLIYNCSFDSTPFSMAPLAIHLQPYDTSAWSTPSFWGASDTGGTHNFYLEKCVFAAYLNAEDNDEGARSVSRYSTFDNAGYGTHGADTSPIGQRYFEYYENVGVFNGYNDGTTFDMVWWFFVRGGTYVIWGNTLPALTSTDYGTKAGVNMTVMNLQRNTGTETSCWGAGFTSGGQFYHAPRQVGMGYVTGLGTVTYSLLGLVNAVTTTVGGYTAYVGDSEPAYIWGNSNVPLNNVGTSDYGGGGCTNPDTSANYIKLGRDYFNGSTVKPGYSPYQYPHPLEQDNQVVGSGPAAPTGLIANVQ